MQLKIEQAIADFILKLQNTKVVNEVLDLKASFVGKTGTISEILKGIKDASIEVKRSLGPLANTAKEKIESLAAERIDFLENELINLKLKTEKVDLSSRLGIWDNSLIHGGIHPTFQVQRELEDIFLSMGFEVLDGPHIEDDYHNFEALNIPDTHPARDMQDTFWFKNKKNLLRTHTSTIQIRGMKERKPPFRFVAPGKVFRCERTDATHEMVFHQLEGMMVGKDINVGHLIYFMKTLLKEIFKKDMEVRLRPGYFPFVEPGFELDIRWKKPDPKKPSERYSGWLELLPCGMVHPNVLKAGGIDPTQYSGFAFGLGLDRLVMVKYGIEDVRHFHRGDLRFLNQFANF